MEAASRFQLRMGVTYCGGLANSLGGNAFPFPGAGGERLFVFGPIMERRGIKVSKMTGSLLDLAPRYRLCVPTVLVRDHSVKLQTVPSLTYRDQSTVLASVPEADTVCALLTACGFEREVI